MLCGDRRVMNKETLSGGMVNFVRGCTRPIGVIIIMGVIAQPATEGKTPPGRFMPFIIAAIEWFVERPIRHYKASKVSK